jgi:hypothetical protein
MYLYDYPRLNPVTVIKNFLSKWVNKTMTTVLLRWLQALK